MTAGFKPDAFQLGLYGLFHHEPEDVVISMGLLMSPEHEDK